MVGEEGGEEYESTLVTAQLAKVSAGIGSTMYLWHHSVRVVMPDSQ